MNTISFLNTIYLHPNRTLETLQLPNGQVYYLYNHQGQYYKLFNEKGELENYLNALPHYMAGEFYSEAAVDVYLMT